jgi:glycine cleavage system transcriptional repressor
MLMDRYAMLAAFGQDRPGIVAALAEGLCQLRCNIEDTCMTRLRGEFAMMIMIRLPENLPPELLVERLAPYISTLELSLLCRGVSRQTATCMIPLQTQALMLSVYGADRPGIVAQVARVVADHGGNITDMNTRVIGSADRPVYVMILEIQLPEGHSPDSLQEALDRLKPTLGVDMTLRAIENILL